MTNREYWNNGPESTSVDLREGGPGNSWKVLDFEAEVDAVSGGRRGVESNWGRNARGGREYIGNSRTGNPERYTGQLMARRDKLNFVRGLLRDLDDPQACDTCSDSGLDVRVRERCGDQRTLVGYEMALTLLDVVSTSTSTDNNLANSSTGDDQLIMDQEAISAGLAQRLTKLVHSNISDPAQLTAINDVTWRCGQEWWVVTNAISSAAAPRVGYTEDNGQNWTFIDINTFANGSDATSIVINGDTVIVAGPAEGISYAQVDDIKNGVASPFADSTGISTQNPNVLALAEDGSIWAAGTGGYIWRSTDGGFSFVEVDAGVTTSNALNAIAVVSDNTVWFGGASGTLLRFLSGTVSTVAITGSPTDAILTLAVADYRSNELYIGTDAGDIYRTNDALAQSPEFFTLGFFQSGTGRIDALRFAGWSGDVLFVVQSNGSSQSRVLRDLSGGAMGNDVEIIGTFTDPANTGLNAIDVRSANDAIVVGNVQSSAGYIGRVIASN